MTERDLNYVPPIYVPGEHIRSPEIAAIQDAGKEYARVQATLMEGFLQGNEVYASATTSTARSGERALTIGALFAVGDKRTLKVHTKPDETGKSTEITYETHTPRTVELDPQALIYAQDSTTDGSSPVRPLSMNDIETLDASLDSLLSRDEWLQLVLERVRTTTRQIIEGQSSDGEA